MADEKTRPYQMRVTEEWLARIDAWRREQTDLPARAEAIRRLVSNGLRFAIAVGDTINTPVGAATVTRLAPALGSVEVEARDGSSHVFLLSEIQVSD